MDDRWTREKVAGILQNACRMWPLLDRQTKDDLIAGKCIYSEYECTPIIDYTKQHPIFQKLNFGPELS